ncbi:acid-sensing ion channel 1 [Plakobranchus ocellatus]|uniref:Acid-sensing ion channel 1 n=1 Tax=Plakobranchus ocellatus TaxID=259542 RepID=A0AAV4C976_9GAST|nr:acid-sensing ion channel 1 [Plakobranchus ocellatus]
MSQRRAGYQALKELVNRTSIWNSAGLSFEDRQALPDAFKRPPDEDPFRRDTIRNDVLTSSHVLGQVKKDHREQDKNSIFSYSTSRGSTDNSRHTDSTVVKPKPDAVEEITEPWVSFGRDSSCHGVKNIENRERSKTARLIWLLITLGMTSGLIYSVIELVINYYEYNTVTRTEVKVADNIIFPSITFCNICPYKYTENGKANPITTLMAQTTIFRDSFAIDYSTPYYQSVLNMSSEEIQQNYSYDVSELIWFAIYEGTTLDLNDAFEVVDTQYGRCFTFNGPKNIKKYGVKRVSYDGRYSGLRIMAQLFQSQYLIMDDMTAGLRMYISQHPETPRLDKDGLELQPGTATKISLSPSKFTFLPPPYHSYGSEPCQETEEMDLREKMYDAPFYSYTACIEQCQDLHAAMNCSCYTSTLKVKGLPPCTVGQDFFCYKLFKDALINNLMNVTCDCPRPCTFYRYDMTISSSQLPSRASSNFILKALRMETDNVERLRDNYLDVRVYLESNIMREETHEPQFTFTSMLAYLGGQMGFFLGASLVTVSEFMETLIISSYVFFKKKVVEMGKMDQKPSRVTKEKNNSSEQEKY